MNIDVDILNDVSNRLSDSISYRRINQHLWSCYYGLPGSAQHKMAEIAFGFILRNKFYGDKAQEVCKKDIDESKRIYNDVSVNMKDILLEWDHYKYSDEKKASLVVSNMNKRIRDLDDDNIIYCWRCEGLYMFIMERYFTTWKCYNSNGCLIPKTLKKIVVVGHDMLTCMERNIKREYHNLNKTVVESSFGCFINRMIDKMNPLVISEVVKWDGNQDVEEYLVQLSENLKNIGDYKGLVIAEDIFQKLPFSVSDKLKTRLDEGIAMKKQKPIEESVSDIDVENSIIPDNPNIARPRRQNKIAQNLVPPKEKINVYEFNTIVDPFQDVTHFMEFYKASLQQHNKSTNIKFECYATDTIYAAQILDLLIGRNRSNKIFLNSWIRYFYEFRLKGNKTHKSKYTSLKAFMDTFDEYNARHTDL